MDLVAYLADAELTRVRAATGAAYTIHAVSSVAELERVVRLRSIDVALVDLEAPGLGDVTTLGPLLGRDTDVPVVAYASVSPEGMRRTLALTALGLRHVALRGYDDRPSALRALLESARGNALSTEIIDQLAPHLDRLSSPLATVIDAMFRGSHRVWSAASVAVVAGVAPRTCARALARAGLAPPSSIARAARVVRAYHALRGGTARVADVATRLGYGSPDGLVGDTRRVTGLRPTALARGLDRRAFVSRVVEHLARSPGHTPGARQPAADVDHAATRLSSSVAGSVADIDVTELCERAPAMSRPAEGPRGRPSVAGA